MTEYTSARLSEDVMKEIRNRGKSGETIDQILRRELKME